MNPDQRMACPADAHSANGAFHPTTDLPAIGASTNSESSRRRIQANRAGRRSCARAPSGHYVREWRNVPAGKRGHIGNRPGIGTIHPRRGSGDWRLPDFPGLPGKWRWRQLRAPAPLYSGKSFRLKQLRRDEMKAIMPAGGGLSPSARGRAPGGCSAIGARHPYEVRRQR